MRRTPAGHATGGLGGLQQAGILCHEASPSSPAPSPPSRGLQPTLASRPGPVQRLLPAACTVDMAGWFQRAAPGRQPEDEAGKSPYAPAADRQWPRTCRRDGGGSHGTGAMSQRVAWEELGRAGPPQVTECSLTILPQHEDSQVLSPESHHWEEARNATCWVSARGAGPGRCPLHTTAKGSLRKHHGSER